MNPKTSQQEPKKINYQKDHNFLALYVIYDTESMSIVRPFFSENDKEALRVMDQMFQIHPETQRKEYNPFQIYPSSYQLYRYMYVHKSILPVSQPHDFGHNFKLLREGNHYNAKR